MDFKPRKNYLKWWSVRSPTISPSHLSTNGYLIYWALIMVKDSKKMLKRKRAMEAVTETLKFGWDFIDAIVTGGDKAPAPCFGGTISMYTCTSFLFFHGPWFSNVRDYPKITHQRKSFYDAYLLKMFLMCLCEKNYK